MRTRAYKTGFTIIEIVVVIAIIAILVSMVIGITKRFEGQGRERLTQATITLLGNALEQFRDFGYEYKSSDYNDLTFPLDCNGFGIVTPSAPYPNLPDTLHDALYSSTAPPITIGPAAQHDPNFSGSEALYFILSQIPECRTTLNKIDKSLLTNKGKDKVTDITITVPTGATTTTLPFTRIIDPWGTTLRYDYYPDRKDNLTGTFQYYIDNVRTPGKKTFPVITSAGPDKLFDTDDDISNVK